MQIAGEGSVSDEEKIRVVSELIAYAHQVFYPRGRFIFLRSLLTMLNKQRAVPNKEMAEALDMSDLAYRVAVYRFSVSTWNALTRSRLALLLSIFVSSISKSEVLLFMN